MSDRTPSWGIYGNAAAVDLMQRAVAQGPHHAYLLTGPASIGKSVLARSFAAALLCERTAGTGGFCGDCSTCRRIARGVHPDVSRFDLAFQRVHERGTTKNRTLNIDTVREIGRHVALRPVEAAWRVVVVDDVETMQEAAQEAFLKTLEEPPAYVVVVMLCADAELLLPTILSRCSVVAMAPVSHDVAVNALVAAGAAEDRADRIARAVHGRVGLGLRALDDQELYDRLTGHVDAAVAWVASDSYERMAESIRLADGFSADREMVFDRLAAVQGAWRELLLERAGGGAWTGTDGGRIARMEDGVRALLAIDRCIRDLEANVRPRAALATMVTAWPQLEVA